MPPGPLKACRIARLTNNAPAGPAIWGLSFGEIAVSTDDTAV